MALLRYPNGWVGLDHEGLGELDGVLSLIWSWYFIQQRLFTDPAIVIYPIIESLHVRKMIRLKLLCLVFIFPSQFRRGLKKRDHVISKFSIHSTIYFSVAFE